MTEKERAARSSTAWHPVVRLVLENPISAFNAMVFVFGGGMVWAQIGNYMHENDARVTRIEHQMKESAITSRVKDDRAAAKTDGIAREVNEVKVTVRGIESAVQFLVQQEQIRHK